MREVLAKPQYWWNPQHPKAGAITGDAVDDQVTGAEPGVDKAKACADTWTCY